MDTFTLSTPISNIAVTQYDGFDFNSYCQMGDTYLAAGPNGIYTVGRCDDFGGSDIDSTFTFLKTDFGSLNMKRLRRMYISYFTTGTLTLRVQVDDDQYRDFLMPPVKVDNKQHIISENLTRDLKGGHFTFTIGNKDGCYFAINRIDVVINQLTNKPRGVKL